VSTQAFLSFLAAKAGFMAVVLAVSYILSLGARYHFILDLFSHFIIQYAVGALVLGMTLLYFQKWPMGGLCFVILAASLYQIYQNFPVVSVVDAKGTSFKVAHYNRFYPNKNFDAMMAWLREQNADVVSVQEITPEAIEKLQALNDLYPYHFPEKKTPGTDVFLMSRYPIVERAIIEVKADVPTTLGLRIRIDSPASITIYAMHTHTPLTHRMQRQRNAELIQMAEVIGVDKTPNIVFLGDWNITPFSPFFKDTVKVSNLRNGYSSYWPAVSWPSQFRLPFLQIPIDQLLFSPHMQLVEKKVGPAMGSDHHPLVARFAIPPSTSSPPQ
jgi:endonuclease/exonuclease/phosphatase (EEP) superfamily protein YafD